MRQNSRTLALLFALALLCGLAFHGFWEKHWESRRAEAAREIAESGNWAVPTLLGEPFVTKPPLTYWTVAALFKLTGTVNDRLSRVPSAALTLASLFLVMGMAKRWRRPDGQPQADPLTAGSIFATMPLVFALGVNTETEPYLLFFTCLAVWAYLRITPGERSLFWRSVLALGLVGGFMIKGPLGWFFPLFGILACEVTAPRAERRLTLLDLGLFLASHALFAAPWFVVVYRTVPGAMKVWLGETIRRVGDETFTIHREPFWYYLPMLAVFGPWLLLLPGAVKRVAGERYARSLWPLLWFAAGVLFLSLASSKRAHYMLSFSPALALSLAAGAQRLKAGGQERLARIFFTFCGWLLPLAALSVMLLLAAKGKLVYGFASALALAILIGGYFLLRKSRALDWAHLCALGLLVSFGVAGAGVVPAVDLYRCPDLFLQRVSEVVGPGEVVGNWRSDRFTSSFYLGRFVRSARSGADLDALMPGGGWLVGEEASFMDRPPRSEFYLRLEIEDPFNSSVKQVWALYKVAPQKRPREVRTG